jgi:WD40-like Beta Propeller Repeat
VGTPEGKIVQRIRRAVVPWTAVALLTAMVAGAAALGVVTSPSFTTAATAVHSPGSRLPSSPSIATTATMTQPSLPNPPAAARITVNASLWRGHGNLAFISSGQLEILSNAGTLTDITGPTGGFDSDVAWSPDDQWLAFLHTGPANGYDIPAPTLWLLKAGSSQAQEVTTSGIGMFAWSPTAPVLAYTIVVKYNFPAGGPENLWFDRPGAPPTSVPVGTGAGLGSIAWSPNGSELAFDDSVFPQPASATSPTTPATGRLGIVSVNDGHMTMVYALADSGIDLAGWWPEGGGLLFWEDTGFSGSNEEDGLTLYSLESGSKQPVALTTSLVGSTWLAPQPGGSTVAVVSGGGRSIWTAGRAIELCSFPTATCQSVPIPAGTVGLAPSWTRSGTLIFAVASASSNDGAFSMAQWNSTNALWSLLLGGQSSPLLSTPAGALLADPASRGSTMVVVADNALWLADIGTAVPATRVAGPLYSTADPDGFYGEVDWTGTFAWSAASGLRLGSQQLTDSGLYAPDPQLP